MTTPHTYFGYRDAPAARTWLQDAFGFRTTMHVPDDGGVAHAELRPGPRARAPPVTPSGGSGCPRWTAPPHPTRSRIAPDPGVR